MNKSPFRVPNAEKEKAGALDETEVNNSPNNKVDKTKKGVPGKAGEPKQEAKTNGTAAKKGPHFQAKGEKNSPAGPKKAKRAKWTERL